MIRLYLTANANELEELAKHLYYNGYDVEWTNDDEVWVFEDELDYVITILEDRNIGYEI